MNKESKAPITTQQFSRSNVPFQSAMFTCLCYKLVSDRSPASVLPPSPAVEVSSCCLSAGSHRKSCGCNLSPQTHSPEPVGNSQVGHRSIQSFRYEEDFASEPVIIPDPHEKLNGGQVHFILWIIIK